MSEKNLYTIAKELVAPGKGILAADESSTTIKKRFDSFGIELTEDNRRMYREMLFTAPDISKQISGVILYDETLRQASVSGKRLGDVLIEQGIYPGIKVDKGVQPLQEGSMETIAIGLDGLELRLGEYHALGARFAKWRSTFVIGQGLPSDKAIEMNADALAAYAFVCQKHNFVPIVEPEVLMDGTHDMQACFDATIRVLRGVFSALKDHGVNLEEMLLKPNMILPGTASGKKATPEQVAEMTVKCLMEAVPPTVPGIVFLSGGQSEQEACENLQAMNAIPRQLPWQLSFSYGRALQTSALKTWSGKPENIPAAQDVFSHRAMLVSAARSGKYPPSMGKEEPALA